MAKPRELTDAERDTLWEQASAAWDIQDQHWHPLAETSRRDVAAFRASAFHEAVGAAGLRAALAAHGVDRVVETREFIELPTRELDLSDADFAYDLAEGYWCDARLDWLVYASHEDSLAIGGEWLIEAVKLQWPDWQAHYWERW
jgi:hypothetical protein